VWYRAVTNTKHIKSNGSLHHAALKSFLGPPETNTVPWRSELSGRLASVDPDYQKDGDERAALQRAGSRDLAHRLQFCGVMYASVGSIREWKFGRVDALFHPTDRDKAHANIVFFDRDPDDLKDLKVLNALLEQISFSSTSALDSIPSPQGGLPR
jgi:hypothetical protein